MKKIYYVLILLVISAVCLFPQSERNDLIGEDTVIAGKIDYLSKTEFADDIMPEEEDGKIGIILLETGIADFKTSLFPWISSSLKVPISDNFHFISKCKIRMYRTKNRKGNSLWQYF